jgi:hypothetical protein
MKSAAKIVFALSFIALCAIPSFGGPTPVRRPSQNGVDNGAPFFNLFGPTTAVPRHGGLVSLATQVVCTNLRVSAANDNTNEAFSGTCDDGNYTFLYQIQSAATNLTVTLTNLVGFPDAVDDAAAYGIEACDNDPANPDSSNTQQLCTQVGTQDISGITSVVNKKNAKITFTVPSIPPFVAGVGRQGQGLTLVVVEKQTAGQPIAVPKITFATK